MIKICQACKARFAPYRSNNKFCSKECREKEEYRRYKKWCKENPERRLATIRKYNETHREEQKIRSKKWYEKNRENAKAYQKLFRENNNARTRAKTAMKNLPKICCACGSIKNIHVHHLDFNPLNNNKRNLIFLCSICHGKAHQRE